MKRKARMKMLFFIAFRIYKMRNKSPWPLSHFSLSIVICWTEFISQCWTLAEVEEEYLGFMTVLP